MGNSSSSIVSIEGNIGSGKSTLLSHLKELFKDDSDVIFVDEPVEAWEQIKDKQGNTMLQKFYMDKEKYAFSFQMMAYISRLALLKKALEENPSAIIITERSLQTDKFVFAKMLYDMDKIEDVNYQIYETWFETFLADCQLAKIVYVRTDPSICLNRIKQRSRNGESTISLDYLEKCHVYHENMMESNKEIPRLELDGNQDISIVLEMWKQKIQAFLDEA
jgi:deoxyadenosine/deoxycytidine kinase